MMTLFVLAGAVIGASVPVLAYDGEPSDPVLQKIFSDVEKSDRKKKDSTKIDVTDQVRAALGVNVSISEIKKWLDKNDFKFSERSIDEYKNFTNSYALEKNVDLILSSAKTTHAKVITMPGIDRWIVFGFQGGKLIYAVAFMFLQYV
ncbi:MAG: hypothetical protein K2X10_07135 [Hyphomicrobiales bacterium]|nr:hypothetical protein [Hyphomicrobiales bacterium]